LLKAEEELESISNREFDIFEESKNVAEASGRSGGSKSIPEMYPDVVKNISEMLELSGSAKAHDRRRDTSTTVVGLSLADIKRQLFTQMPELLKFKLDRSTIHKWLNPRVKSSINGRSHLSFINARVKAKSKCARIFNKDAHHAAAQVRYNYELAAYTGEWMIFSNDDKMKVKIGIAAVNDLIKNVRFVLNSV
jgi:hypothetical protein